MRCVALLTSSAGAPRRPPTAGLQLVGVDLGECPYDYEEVLGQVPIAYRGVEVRGALSCRSIRSSALMNIRPIRASAVRLLAKAWRSVLSRPQRAGAASTLKASSPDGRGHHCLRQDNSVSGNVIHLPRFYALAGLCGVDV
jgi:hypothetical protein